MTIFMNFTAKDEAIMLQNRKSICLTVPGVKSAEVEIPQIVVHSFLWRIREGTFESFDTKRFEVELLEGTPES